MEAVPVSVADGRYVVVRRLGAGGMGAVYLASDTRLDGRLVALKLLRGALPEASLRSRFRREARLMAGLRHPGLVEIYDVCLDGPEPYLAQEYVEGEDLHHLLARRKRLDGDEVLRLARDLASVLACLHGAGVIHRDVKPSNVMVEPDGHARLADLGLAVGGDCTRLTAEGSLIGTVLYMSPEAVRGDLTTPAVDVFALGLVLHQAATGRHPFLGTCSAHEYMLRLAAGRLHLPDLPDGLPPALATTLAACLEPDPARRPPDGAAVVALLAGDAPPPTRGGLARLPAPRVLVAALALGAAALVLGGAFTGSRAPKPAAADAAPSEPVPVPLPGPALPRVTCLLDGIRLDLPHGLSGGATARLETLEGELVTERPLRDGFVVLNVPEGVEGDVRWSLSLAAPGGGPGVPTEGLAAVGPRLLFDSREHAPPATDPKSVGVGTLPFVHHGRLFIPAIPSAVHVLRPARRPGEPLTLERDETWPLTSTSDFGILTSLVPLGPDSFLALGRGSPAALASLPPSPGSTLDVKVIAGMTVAEALAVPLPGGGCVVAAATLATPSTREPPQVTLGFWSGPPVDSPRGVLALPGTRPLALVPLDAAGVLLAHAVDREALASVVRCDGTTPTVSTSLVVPMPSPALEAGFPALPGERLPGGGAVIGFERCLVVADADGRLRRIDLDLPPLARVAALVPGAGSTLHVITAVLTAPPLFNFVALHPVAVDLATGVVGESGPRMAAVSERMDRLVPLARALLPDGGLVLYCGHRVLVTGPPPLFPLRHAATVKDRGAAVLVTDDAVWLVARIGRVRALELAGP